MDFAASIKSFMVSPFGDGSLRENFDHKPEGLASLKGGIQ